MDIQKKLSQAEIDTLVDALNNLKDYGQDPDVSNDLLYNQVVLSQSEIDRLIASLSGAKVKTDPICREANVALSQKEIDSLIDALNTVKQYDTGGAFAQEITRNQIVLSQSEIDKLIATLTGLKAE
ncbi:MAG: hypothetical protein K6G45_01420 [Lachnospiraceae bacterium]|nr:hypothetical protein [Lachnospiraceae bacterium]